MRDIPVFTTENGAASLILKKIPYTKEAFVHIRDSAACEALIRECVDFCRIAGAERVFATGHIGLKQYPETCSVYRYSCKKNALPTTDAVAIPITPEQKEWWRGIYNQKMAHVPTASLLSSSDVDAMIKEQKAFYVCFDCLILGIGVAQYDEIQAIASVSPGGGREVVLALANSLDCQFVSLSVASTNVKAINLYDALGFIKTDVEGTWYEIC